MKPLIQATVISFSLVLLVGCGSNFEWLPEAGTASTSSTDTSVTAPVANAGAARSVIAGTLVTLDGSGSTAANGATLSYSWSFTTKPSGSIAVLSNAAAVNPTFTPDIAGDYVFSLVVNDGTANSTAATVTITATTANRAPVANAGANQSVVTGSLVTLDGSASSDADNNTLTYLWAITSKPPGSNATLSSPTAARPAFTADVAGTYLFSLVVNDGKVSSVASSVSVTAANTGSITVTW